MVSFTQQSKSKNKFIIFVCEVKLDWHRRLKQSVEKMKRRNLICLKIETCPAPVLHWLDIFLLKHLSGERQVVKVFSIHESMKSVPVRSWSGARVVPAYERHR